MSSAVRLLAYASRDESLSSASAIRRAHAQRLRAVPAGASAPPRTVLIVAGTRPECIKVAPLIHALSNHPDLAPLIVNSGQHLLPVRACLAEMGLHADIELAALPSLPLLSASHRHLRLELGFVMRHCDPDLVIVQGDTLTAYSAARAARDAG